MCAAASTRRRCVASINDQGREIGDDAVRQIKDVCDDATWERMNEVRSLR